MKLFNALRGPGRMRSAVTTTSDFQETAGLPDPEARTNTSELSTIIDGRRRWRWPWQRISKGPILPSNGDPLEPLDDLDPDLRNKGIFLYALLHESQSADDKSTIYSIAANWFRGRASTNVPPSIDGDPFEVARELLEIVLSPSLLPQGYPKVRRKKYIKLQKYLHDDWGYDESVVIKMLDQIKRRSDYNVADIVINLNKWVDLRAKELGKYTDTVKLRKKIRELLRKTGHTLSADADLAPRYKVLDSLLDFEVWNSVKDGQAYEFKSWGDADDALRLAVRSFSGSAGAVSLMDDKSDHDLRSMWSIERCEGDELKMRLSPKIVPNLKLVGNKVGLEVSASLGCGGGADAYWVIMRHRDDKGTFVLLNVFNDAVLIRSGDAVTLEPVSSGSVDLGCWLIDRHK
jgi:hypothetical protein